MQEITNFYFVKIQIKNIKIFFKKVLTKSLQGCII